MARAISKVAPQWWDYTTLDAEILGDAAKLTEKTLFKLSRPGFTVHYYETLEDFYLAEALEYTLHHGYEPGLHNAYQGGDIALLNTPVGLKGAARLAGSRARGSRIVYFC